MDRQKSNGICMVCVYYKSKNLAATIRAIEEIRCVVTLDSIVFVANDLESRQALATHGAQVCKIAQIIQHDNSGMEFGAYQAGLDHLLNEIDSEWVLFGNDTFATHHKFGAVHRDKLASDLTRRYDYPAFIGQIVSWPRAFQIEGARTHRWMSTNLFALNREALRRLGSQVYRPDLDALVTETGAVRDFFSARVDPVLREHLEAWLFRLHPGWHWYASDPLQPSNAGRMARKARSILQEKYLAALLEDLSAAFIDLNDLSIYRKVQRELERRMFALKKRVSG